MVRRANAQKHLPSQNSLNFSTDKKNVKCMACTYFNWGTCLHLKIHETRKTYCTSICTHHV